MDSVIKKIFDAVSFEKILQYLSEVIDFYFRPIRFFNNFFSKTSKEKFIQFIFYSILILLLGFVLIETITIRELTKALLFELATSVTVIIILSLSNLIISKIQKSKFEIEKIVYFVFLVKILLAPFQVIFFGLFIAYENYNFFFFQNLVVLCLYIYVYAFSGKIFHYKFNLFLLSIFLNLLFINTMLLVRHKLSIDTFSTFENPYFTDQILRERLVKKELISDFYKIPNYRAVFKNDQLYSLSFVISSNPFGSIASASVERTENFRATLLNNISILETINNSIQFERNRVFFEIALSKFRMIDNLYSMTTFSEDEIQKVIAYDDSIEVMRWYMVSGSNDIARLNNELLMNQYKMQTISYFALLPLKIVQYTQPILLLTRRRN